MAFYRGLTGYAALGDQLSGTPYINGALLAGVGTMNVDGNGSTLLGALAVGDTFTIAGESGTPTHTVTGGPFYVASGDAITSVTFTPSLATGGVADNAQITVTSNAVAQVIQWSMNADMEELDSTVMGDYWKSVVAGQSSWRGSLQVRLDYGDARQAALIDKIIAATPNATVSALVLGVEKSATPSIRQFYGAAILKGVSITSQNGQLVTAAFEFTGSGSARYSWS